MSDALTSEQLFIKYGKHPKRLSDRIPGQVLVFEHESYEQALDYADSNRKHYGHPTGLENDGDHWITVVNLGPAIARVNGQ